jgi:DNA-binding response OmpR family regulator
MINLKNLRFLIVDDDRDIRETLKEHLELYEAICDEAQDGLIAFDKIKNNKYDFVISDIRMPNASGIDLLNMIKDYEGVAPKVIMMSAFSDLTIEGVKELGALGLYLKPQNLESLFELIKGNF